MSAGQIAIGLGGVCVASLVFMGIVATVWFLVSYVSSLGANDDT